jgi:glutathione synthase/RimK-type ligase-like ATP-grasp enzyme
MVRLALAYDAARDKLLPEDRLTGEALAARGAEVVWASWDATDVDWSAFDAVVLRTCYGYHTRLPAFVAWLGCAARFINPAPLVRWNANKTYLQALERQGMATVPTAWISRGAAVRLADLMADRAWDDVVVKPTVSAGAMHTRRVKREEAAAAQGWLAAMLADQAMMVQPFLPEVCAQGEWSLLFFGGALSHAVLKVPRVGDFRVQGEHGGSFTVQTPPAAARAVAQRLLAGLGAPAAYARVDGVMQGGAFLLMELEVIEPYLYLGADPQAGGRYVDALWSAATRDKGGKQ